MSVFSRGTASRSRVRTVIGGLAIAGASALVLAGCASHSDSGPGSGTARDTGGTGADVPVAPDGADEVVLVTSSWHARRARLLVEAALDPDVRLTVATPGRTRPPHLIGRELAWLPVSLASRTLTRRRR